MEDGPAPRRSFAPKKSLNEWAKMRLEQSCQCLQKLQELELLSVDDAFQVREDLHKCIAAALSLGKDELGNQQMGSSDFWTIALAMRHMGIEHWKDWKVLCDSAEEGERIADLWTFKGFADVLAGFKSTRFQSGSDASNTRVAAKAAKKSQFSVRQVNAAGSAVSNRRLNVRGVGDDGSQKRKLLTLNVMLKTMKLQPIPEPIMQLRRLAVETTTRARQAPGPVKAPAAPVDPPAAPTSLALLLRAPDPRPRSPFREEAYAAPRVTASPDDKKRREEIAALIKQQQRAEKAANAQRAAEAREKERQERQQTVADCRDAQKQLDKELAQAKLKLQKATADARAASKAAGAAGRLEATAKRRAADKGATFKRQRARATRSMEMVEGALNILPPDSDSNVVKLSFPVRDTRAQPELPTYTGPVGFSTCSNVPYNAVSVPFAYTTVPHSVNLCPRPEPDVAAW